jgi:hypothetical protein
MGKKKKIQKAELEALQQLVASRNEIIKTLGELEIKKIQVASNFEAVENSLNDRRAALEEKYGHINVNLSTGEYEEIKEE